MIKKITRRLYRVLLFILIDPIIRVITHKSCKPVDNNKLLAIIRFDAIGDYILFRNYLKDIRQSNKFAGYKIILVGNIVWSSIATYYDFGLVDEFIWINKSTFFKNLYYRIKIVKQIRNKYYTTILHPTYWRETVSGDALLYFMYATEKIGCSGEVSLNISNFMAKFYYTKLMKNSSEIMFEFFRNQEFFQYVLDQPLFTKLELASANTDFLGLLDTPYVVLFIGAGEPKRKWHIDNFIQVAKFIELQLGLKVVFCGGKEDLYLNDKIHNQNLYSLVGKTNLLELIDIIAGARFVVSNETSVPHMAVALNIMVFVISNGNDFGRFTPYPLLLTNKYHSLYPQCIMQKLNQLSYLQSKYQRGSSLDINQIKVNDVIKFICEHYASSLNVDL